MQDKVLAVMQPYLFPYAGYFSLMHSSTDFVFYDDVDFIKQGWVNRNRVLVNGQPQLFSVPLVNGSSNVSIKDVLISENARFYTKLIKTLEQSYSKALFYARGMEYVMSVLSPEERNLSTMAIKSVNLASEIIGITPRKFHSSAYFADTKGVDRSERLLRICESLQCKTLVNPIGGCHLYSKDVFSKRGVELKFIKTKIVDYSQLKTTAFVPNLSIIDLLMHLPSDEILEVVQSYELL
jgi:hypothetical protein